MDDPGALAADLRRAAARLGTPIYAVDVASLDAAAAELAAAFPDPWQRRYSLKANDEPAIVRLLSERGLGANVVSRGEWALAGAAGVPNAAVTLEGVGKSDADLRAAVRAAVLGEPLAWLAVESADELRVLERLAHRAGLGRGGRPALEVLLRLNPDVAPETHHGLAVGRGISKFGLTETELTAAVDAWRETPAIALRGIQVHVGSQLAAVDAWRDAVRLALAIVGLLRGGIDTFDTLDVGGGFPVGARDGGVPAPATFARLIPGLLEGIPEDRRPRRWGVEPGRFLVANAGWLVGRVLHVRDRAGAPPLVVLDTGMTELIRPALYGAHHPVVALTSRGRPVHDGLWRSGDRARVPTRVEGPVCEATDSLGIHPLPPVRRGDLVAIAQAGAYADSMASTYNGRARPPVVLIGPHGEVERVRRRGRLGR